MQRVAAIMRQIQPAKFNGQPLHLPEGLTWTVAGEATTGDIPQVDVG